MPKPQRGSLGPKGRNVVGGPAPRERPGAVDAGSALVWDPKRGLLLPPSEALAKPPKDTAPAEGRKLERTNELYGRLMTQMRERAGGLPRVPQAMPTVIPSTSEPVFVPSGVPREHETWPPVPDTESPRRAREKQDWLARNVLTGPPPETKDPMSLGRSDEAAMRIKDPEKARREELRGIMGSREAGGLPVGERRLAAQRIQEQVDLYRRMREADEVAGGARMMPHPKAAGVYVTTPQAAGMHKERREQAAGMLDTIRRRQALNPEDTSAVPYHPSPLYPEPMSHTEIAANRQHEEELRRSALGRLESIAAGTDSSEPVAGEILIPRRPKPAGDRWLNPRPKIPTDETAADY